MTFKGNMAKAILQAFAWVDQSKISYYPFTVVVKEMVEAGIRKSLYLMANDRENDENLEDAVVYTPFSTYVNISIEPKGGESSDSYQTLEASGSVHFLGNRVKLNPFDLSILEDPNITAEDFEKYIGSEEQEQAPFMYALAGRTGGSSIGG